MNKLVRIAPPRSPQIGAGHRLAIEMFEELEQMDENAEQEASMSAQLEKQYRGRKPYRNIALEYLARAREAGPQVEEGFMMILSDIVALNADGFGVHAERYVSMVENGTIASDTEVRR